MSIQHLVRRGWWVVVLAAGAAAAWYVFRDARRSESPGSPRSITADLPPVTASPYLNTTGAVRYVGSEQCAGCHDEQHASYLQTAHSLALSVVDAEREPPDAEFLHRASGRRYAVYRENGALRHRESLPAAADVDGGGRPGERVLHDHPLRYLVGSGRHSRTYLAELDGFLIESPITWYASKQRWAMSPGYDQPEHQSFQRTAETGCLICHAGRVEPEPGSAYKVRLHELAIGCESCHGPGSLHVERRTQGADAGAGDDLTIVHPGRLSRELQEDTCAMCHLRGDATVFVRGRRPEDFRPGLRLADFRMDYGVSYDDREMKVVGHVEQMRLSRCWTASETLTCTTCHNPHAPAASERRLEHYRGTCLSCHEPASCGLPVDERRRRQPADDCTACHMPQVPTDIPHIAFTHHRIGIHASEPSPDAPGGAASQTGVGSLVPLADASHLPEIEQRRLLGLAYVELADKAPSATAQSVYRDRAYDSLADVRREGVRDADVEAALGRLLWDQGQLERARDHAESALQLELHSATARINALFVAGEASVQLGQAARARGAFEQLVLQRRHAQDWLLLGLLQRDSGLAGEARRSFERAAPIDPARADIQRLLDRSGTPREALAP